MKTTLSLLLLCFVSYATLGYDYESVEQDNTETRVYKLENGLTVYLSRNTVEPRIQTRIAVRAGSRNDPAHATGLAHYLEHMLFKGTDIYGTQDYAKEEPLLNEIRQLYGQYNSTTDEAERKRIYRAIDSVSTLAAAYAIPNEFDKMMGIIGATGINAYTSVEETVYVNEIPSNALKTWLDIEKERFRNPVLRLFHTELEAVFEEKNISLAEDGTQVYYKMQELMYPGHPYGTQTVIGTIEHLKNPDLYEVQKYFDSWYVPNNMAVCLAGDLDYDETIALVDKAFGSMKAKPLPSVPSPQIPPLVGVAEEEILGKQPPVVLVGFRLPGNDQRTRDLMALMDMVMSNGTAGLIDIHVEQAGLVHSATCYPMELNEHAAQILRGEPHAGQTLEEVRDLLLAQVEKVKKGEFDDWLLPAVINDFSTSDALSLRSNGSRVSRMVDAFIGNKSWSDVVERNARLATYSKEDVVAFANKHFGNNYAVLYKRQADVEPVVVEKPEITPLSVNRDVTSPFVEDIAARNVDPLAPKFVDYRQDITEFRLKNGTNVVYVYNFESDITRLTLRFPYGTDANPWYTMAVRYLEKIGAGDLTAAQFEEEMYKTGCRVGISSGRTSMSVTITGLEANIPAALKLMISRMTEGVADEEALALVKQSVLKQRADATSDKRSLFWGGLYNMARYGNENPNNTVPSNADVEAVTSEALLKAVKQLLSTEFEVLYYGPLRRPELIGLLVSALPNVATLAEAPSMREFPEVHADTPVVYFLHYPMEQAEVGMIGKVGEFAPGERGIRRLFNTYFGGGMSSIVFQEIRESRALAYSTFASNITPSEPEQSHWMLLYLGTQADKLPEALKALYGLTQELPMSETSIEIARQSVRKTIESERIVRGALLNDFVRSRRMGYDEDPRFVEYNFAGIANSEHVQAFYDKAVKGLTYSLFVIGDRSRVDMETLKEYGEVIEVTPQQVLGY